MTVRDTSLESYASIAEKLPGKRREVYREIFGQSVSCDQEIADSLGWPLHHVSPRRGELERDKCIVSIGTKKFNGQTVHFWKVTGEFWEAEKRESKADYWRRLFEDEKAKNMRLEEEIAGLRPKNYNEKQGEFWQ